MNLMPMIKIKMQRKICKSQYKVLKMSKIKRLSTLDSQPDVETNVQNLERQPERIVFTPTRDSSKEVPMSSVNDHTSSILRRRFRLSSQHHPENIISDLTKGTQTRSSLKNLCALSAFVSLVEPMDIK